MKAPRWPPIIPLKREAGVIGAIVIEGDEPGDVLIAEVRNVRLLAAIAAVSLETMWEIEEVTRRKVKVSDWISAEAESAA